LTFESLTQTAPGDRLAARGVLGEDRGTEPVGRVVGQADGLLGVGDPHDGQRRAEGLLAHDVHRVVDADEHRRLVPVAALPVVPARAADDDLRALRTRVVDMALDDVDLRREGDRADVGRARPGGALVAQRARLLGDLRDELVVDRRLDVDALDADAGLAAVEHRVVDGAVGGALEVGVG
jgi:hypothetical protein